MSATKDQEIDDALAEIKKQVERQLGVQRPPPVDVDPTSLVRFSPSLRETLKPDERRELLARAEPLHPWLQGPFLLAEDVVIGGAWRSDQRWIGLGERVPPDLTG